MKLLWQVPIIQENKFRQIGPEAVLLLWRRIMPRTHVSVYNNAFISIHFSPDGIDSVKFDSSLGEFLRELPFSVLFGFVLVVIN